MAAPEGRHLLPFRLLRKPGQTTGRNAGWSALNGHKVDRRVLASSIDFEFEFQLVALIELGQAGPFHCADMHERIGFAIVARDEAEALHGIEELHRAGGLLASALTLRRSRSALLDRDHITNDLKIGCGNLAAAIDEVEGQFLTFSETFKACALDLADMDEHVLSAAFLLDKAEALASIEELHGALAGTNDLGRHTATTAAATRAAETTAAATGTAEAAATAAARTATTEAIAAAKAVTTAEAIATTETIGITEPRTAIHEGIKAVFADAIPFVASPAATTSVKTHET